MKTIFTLISSLLLSMTLLANNGRNRSEVMIRSMDNADIRVVMDGRRFEPNDNALIIHNVKAGKHDIKVYRQARRGIFHDFINRYELVYSGRMQVKNRTQLFISIERNGFVNIAENRIPGNGRFDDRRHRDFDFDNGGRFGDYDTRYGYERAMQDREFERVLQSIDKEWFEGNKIKSAVHVVRNNMLSTDQVKELMRLFTFENNRLELAKQAYDNVVDKWNYREVYTLFSFEASKRELEREVMSRR
jgi:hypothetical protein